MISFNKKTIPYLIFLELISLTPIIILLGNVVPPFPLKVHFIAFGITFLVASWILINNPQKKWVIYLFVFYLIIQPFLDYWDIKSIIDFFFGPFVLLILIDLLINNRVPDKLLRKYEKRFYYLLWVPVCFAVLQFFDILPLTFWNATYVNSALVNGVYIPRPNGFLYHGSELSIIICFIALFQYFKTEKKSFWMLILMIFICVCTYFKAILGCVILLFIYYLLFVNKGPLSAFKIISKKKIYWYGSIILLIAVTIALQFFNTVHNYTGYYFPPQMLTGRGGIWNIYLEGMKDFTFWNYLFGSGMGSAFQLFENYASAETFYPLITKKKLDVRYDTHNAVLSIFINSGIVGIIFVGFLFKMIYTQVVTWKPSALWNKRVFFGVFIIPLFTIGVTIIIYEMAIIWSCIGFLFYRWYFHTHKNNS